MLLLHGLFSSPKQGSTAFIKLTIHTSPHFTCINISKLTSNPFSHSWPTKTNQAHLQLHDIPFSWIEFFLYSRFYKLGFLMVIRSALYILSDQQQPSIKSSLSFSFSFFFFFFFFFFFKFYRINKISNHQLHHSSLRIILHFQYSLYAGAR